MNRIEGALNVIDTAIEALELITRQESFDFVSGECLSMLTELVSKEMATQSGIIRDELQRPKRNAA